MKRALVVGLGTLGRAILGSGWLAGYAVEAASRSSRADTVPCHALDLADERAVPAFFRGKKFDLVVNCAAMTDVDACEKSPREARRLNALAVRDLARASAASGAAFMHVSTNYVFSGLSPVPYREDDAAGPCSIYGMTKLEGEWHALREHMSAVVVRSSWIFGGTKRDFIAHFMERFASNERLEVIGDQTASLTYAPDLAEAMGPIAGALFGGRAAAGRSRVLHVVNSGALTRYDLLLEMKRILGKTNRIVKVPQDKFARWAAVRPRQSALSPSLYERLFGVRLRSWREALREHLEREAVACAS